jgi:predicted Zn-dependent peptidase
MVQKSVLENGIRVITEKIPAAHSVTIGFWVENGSRHESVADNGISHFLEHMLFKGTETRSAVDIAKEIDSVGGVLNGFTSREYSCYYAKVLARKLHLAIDLISDIVLNSIFDLDEIEKERRVILQEIYMLEDTPDDYIHDLFSQNFWRGHPLGLPVLGSRETVAKISREGLFDLLKRRYCGKNILICAAGHLEHQEIVDRLDDVFTRVVPGEKKEGFTIPRHHRRIHILEKDLEQVHICLGTCALPQNHPNRFESYLLNAILGGSMSSRLFQKVREELGLAYSIYSYLSSHSDTGALVLYSGTSPESASQVTATMLKELGRLKKELVSEEELSSAREQVRGSLLLSMESTDNRMTRLAKNEIYMGRQVSLKEVLRGLDLVAREQVRQLAEFILQDDNLNLQMIGKVHEADFPLVDLTLG